MKAQGVVPGIQIAHAGRKGSMQRPWFGNGPLTRGGPRARREDLGHRRADGRAHGRGPYRAAAALRRRSRRPQGPLGGRRQARAGGGLRGARDPQCARLPDAHVPLAAVEQAQRRLRRRLRRTHALSPRGGGGRARGVAQGQAGVPARLRRRRPGRRLDHGRHRGLRQGAQAARHRRDRLLLGRPRSARRRRRASSAAGASRCPTPSACAARPASCRWRSA